MRHYEIEFSRVLKNGERWLVYGLDHFDNINDLWGFIGYIINSMQIQITFTSLQYYNPCFNIKWFINQIKENDNIIGLAKAPNGWSYELTLKEVE